MTTTFKYDYEKAVELCCEYSDDPETLRKLIERLKIKVGPSTVIPSPWNDDLKVLRMIVTVEGYTFPYHGSHNDAMAFHQVQPDWGDRQIAKQRKEFRNGLLYSILCCVGSDLHTLYEDPEDFGMNSDSIKDMAKWNEIKEHTRKLSSALKLTSEEMESLPS